MSNVKDYYIMETLTVYIDQYVIACIDGSNYGIEFNSTKEALEFVRGAFEREYNTDYNKTYYPNKVKRVAEWFMGLPSAINIDFENYQIISLGVLFNQIPFNATDEQEDEYIANWFALTAQTLVDLWDENDIDY